MTDMTQEPVEPVEDPQAIPTPDHEQDMTDYALDWLQQSVITVITTKLVPQLIGWGALTLFLAKVQDWIGLDLDPVVVATFVGIVLVGVAGTVIQYVRNHGQGAAILGQAMIRVQEVGQLGIDLTPPGALHPGAGAGENVEADVDDPMPGDAIIEPLPVEPDPPVDPTTPPGISGGRIDQ